MKVMQSSLVLFFALVVQLLSTAVVTNADPTTTAATPAPTKYATGDMIQAKPKDWGDPSRNTLRHWGAVVGKNPNNDKYKVAQISSHLKADQHPHQDDAIKYHDNAKKEGSKINTGKPVEVAHEHLRLANAEQGWTPMKPEKLEALKTEINKNCPEAGLRRRGLACPLPKHNQNASKGKSRQLDGKKAGPKPNQKTPKGQSHLPQGKKPGLNNAPKGQSRQIQGKKPGPKPNQNAPKGQSRQVQGKKPGPKPTNQNAWAKGQSRLLQGKKPGPTPNQQAPKGQPRQLQGKQAGPKPNRNAPQGKSQQLRGKKAWSCGQRWTTVSNVY
jgi:hypothetical protein